MWWVKVLAGFARVLVSNLIPFLTVIFRSRTSLIAENLFLRKQLAFYQEHKRKPQRLREALPFDQLPRYLLRDRDTIFGQDFRDQVRDMGIREVLSAPRSPWQRATSSG